MMMSEPTRIFVLGLQRSGTTLVANMLAGLPQVYAVEAEDHNGVHESIFYSHFAKAFGQWDEAPAREKFKKAFQMSDYALLSGTSEQDINTDIAKADSFSDVFVSFMDRMTLANGATAWIEKSPHHTVLIDEIRSSVPSARFILIERSIADLVWSRLHGFGRRPKQGMKLWADIVRGATIATLYNRFMRRQDTYEDALLIQYSDLVGKNAEEPKSLILAHINLALPANALTSRYKANSSFSSQDQKENKRFFGYSSLIKFGTLIGSMIPLTWFVIQQKSKLKPSRTEWPDWCFKRSGYRP